MGPSRPASTASLPQRLYSVGVAPGFTFVEIMIVVAIIGILASFAWPIYLDYTARSKVAEALGNASACTRSVTEYYQNKMRMPVTVAEAGCSTAQTPYVAAVAVSDGRVTVTLRGVDPLKADGRVVGFQPYCGAAACDPGGGGGPITAWHCDATRASTTVAESFLPPNCR